MGTDLKMILARSYCPKYKQWRCIDFVIMKKRNRRMCVDVAARRGTECNINHNLVCDRLCLKQGNWLLDQEVGDLTRRSLPVLPGEKNIKTGDGESR